MKITFIKIARYGSQIPSHQKYRFYRASAKQEIDIDVDQPISYIPVYRAHEYQLVYSSPLRRAQSSACYLSKRVIVLPQLTEVVFDLTKLLSAQEYNLYGSSLVRERFVQAFVQDNLLESRAEIIARVRTLVDYLIETNASEVVCVSHSFFMRIVEADLSGAHLLENPIELINFIVAETKTYPYGGGFIYKVQSVKENI